MSEQARIDGIGLGSQPQIVGKAAHARAMCPVHGEAQRDGHVEHVPLVAAGRLAHDQERSQFVFAVALQLGLEQTTHRLHLVGDAALLIGWRAVHNQTFFRHLERNDMIERRANRRHSCVDHLGFLDCMRPRGPLYRSDGSGESGAGLAITCDRVGSIPATTARRW